jgi:hypothetical protein
MLLQCRNGLLKVVDAGLELRTPDVEVGDEGGDRSLDADDGSLHVVRARRELVLRDLQHRLDLLKHLRAREFLARLRHLSDSLLIASLDA